MIFRRPQPLRFLAVDAVRAAPHLKATKLRRCHRLHRQNLSASGRSSFLCVESVLHGFESIHPFLLLRNQQARIAYQFQGAPIEGVSAVFGPRLLQERQVTGPPSKFGAMQKPARPNIPGRTNVCPATGSMDDGVDSSDARSSRWKLFRPYRSCFSSAQPRAKARIALSDRERVGEKASVASFTRSSDTRIASLLTTVRNVSTGPRTEPSLAASDAIWPRHELLITGLTGLESIARVTLSRHHDLPCQVRGVHPAGIASTCGVSCVNYTNSDAYAEPDEDAI